MTVTGFFGKSYRQGIIVFFTDKNGKKLRYNSTNRTLMNVNTQTVLRRNVRMSNVMSKANRQAVRRRLPELDTPFLVEQNRFRHAKYIRPLIRKQEQQIPSAYLPVKRIGGAVRSADGAAFSLRDRSKVGKIVFYKTEAKLKNIMQEYEIGKRMGEIGVGPHVHRYYMIDGSNYHNVPKNLHMNIFKPSEMKKAVYIIMENLAHGAKNLQTLEDYLDYGNPYPTEQISKLVSKMHARNIQHGDLHIQNILVKTFPNGHTRFYIIDYGRSLYVPAKNAKKYMMNVMGFKTYSGNVIHRPNKASNALRRANANLLPSSVVVKTPLTTPLSPLKRMFEIAHPRYTSSVTNKKFNRTPPSRWWGKKKFLKG